MLVYSPAVWCTGAVWSMQRTCLLMTRTSQMMRGLDVERVKGGLELLEGCPGELCRPWEEFPSVEASGVFGLVDQLSRRRTI